MQDSGLSAEAGSSDKSSGEIRGARGDADLESIMSGAASRSITTPIRTSIKTAVTLESNPSVILDKKTLRNYTPRESSCLLRQFEEERLYSGGGPRLGHAPYSSSDQFSSLTGRKGRRKSSVGGSDMTETRVDTMATCTSNVSAWSAASFDWHAGPSSDVWADTGGDVTKMNPMSDHARDSHSSSFSSRTSDIRERIRNARVPPDGAPATNDRTADPKLAKTKPQKLINADQKKSKVDHFADDNSDGLGNLRKLLKEGKIAGLNDKPPAFTPPSPPSKTSVNKSNKKQKAPSPRAADKSTVNNGNKNKTEKRLAPPPPPKDNAMELKPPPPSALVQFLGGRRVHSVENIAEEVDRVSTNPGPQVGGSDQLKRSTSMHGHKNGNYRQFISRCRPPAHYNAALFRISWQIAASEGFRGPTNCGLDREEIPLQQFVQGNLEKEAGAIFA